MLVGAALTLSACDPQPAGEPVARIEFDKNGKVASATPTAKPTPTPAANSACKQVVFEGAKLTHCVADPKTDRIHTALGPKGDKPFGSFAALKAAMTPEQQAQVAFAVSGGAVGNDGKPVGYYVQNSKRLQELNRGSGEGNFYLKPNGVFYGSGKSWRVRTTDDFYSSVGDRPQWGTQAGPMLLVGGKLAGKITEDGPSQAIRNAVAVDGAGKAHFVIADTPVSFGKLARFYRDQLKISTALTLGSSVSGLWDPASGRMDNRGRFGPILVVTKIEAKPAASAGSDASAAKPEAQSQ